MENRGIFWGLTKKLDVGGLSLEALVISSFSSEGKDKLPKSV
jgi:hypothetical protein